MSESSAKTFGTLRMIESVDDVERGHWSSYSPDQHVYVITDKALKEIYDRLRVLWTLTRSMEDALALRAKKVESDDESAGLAETTPP